MICPSCKCEYIRGVMQCADCGVALVDAIDPATAPSSENSGVVAVWAGDDPATCAAVKEALTKAEIPFVDQSSSDYFILRSMHPKTEICVRITDEQHARKVLLEVPSGVDLGELTPEEIASLAIPESDEVGHDEAERVSTDNPEDWDDQEQLSEVWGGNNEDLANTLMMCFRENGIPSQKGGDKSHWHLAVRAEQESRAKEIVREVVEASPPE
jgi:hypothetical protein